MDIVNMSKKKYNTLTPLELNKKITNTEAKIFLYVDRSGKEKIFKNLHRLKGSIFANKLYTIEMLDNNKEYLPESFVIPEKLVSVNGTVFGCQEKYIEGTNLEVVLNNPKIDLENKLYCLKTIGNLLEYIKHVRNETPLKCFYINDLHASNFIVSKGNIYTVDLDSAKICDNQPFPSKFLSSKSILNYSEKYKKYEKGDSKGNYNYEYREELGYIDADENSDLFCYSMMILNFLYKSDVNKMNIDEYYKYLLYLKSIGIDRNLISCFEKLLSNDDNENPKDYISRITYEQLFRASKKEYKKVLKNKKDKI